MGGPYSPREGNGSEHIRPKRILAFAGRNGSGKETAAREMARLLGGAETHTYSDILQETFKLWGFYENSRHEMQELSTFMRKLKGQDCMAKVMVNTCNLAIGNDVVIDGVRRVEDLDLLIERFGKQNVYLIWIEVEADVRYQRLRQRKEKAGEQFMSRDLFDAQEQAESERKLIDVFAASHNVIDNNGTLGALQYTLSVLHHDLIVGPC